LRPDLCPSCLARPGRSAERGDSGEGDHRPLRPRGANIPTELSCTIPAELWIDVNYYGYEPA
jgi:hypothetical protein